MKPLNRKSNRAGFSIVELLTVMSVVVLLISLLVPALNRVQRYAREVKQRAQFHAIDVAMELWYAEQEEFPPSDAAQGNSDTNGDEYCGAMKLAEAMVGQDLLGYHPASIFRADGDDSNGDPLYSTPTNSYQPDADNLAARKGPFLQLENANANRIEDIYTDTDVFSGDEFVLCDVYEKRTPASSQKIGMPILYYKANTSGKKHDPDSYSTDEDQNIYDYKDNIDLVNLGIPGSTEDHPMASSGTYGSGAQTLNSTPKRFYEITLNEQIQIDAGRPYRSDSYILISAGFDGMYGTDDDIFNFEK